MITIRKASERGRTRLDWLDSRHTFSFGDYFDPRENGFSVLRVVNDDHVAGGGFSTHAHRDMEIITYVLEGAVEHRDSLGTRSLIPAGDLQRMTAGTGITHSEFNPSPSNPLHFLQIWIIPERPGLKPGYDQKSLGPRSHNVLSLVASSTGHDDSLTDAEDLHRLAPPGLPVLLAPEVPSWPAADSAGAPTFDSPDGARESLVG